MARTNVVQFNLGVRRQIGRIDGVRKNRTKATALRALSGLVLSTRFDTGRARGNWQVGEGRPPEGFQEDRMDTGGSRTISNGMEQIGRASGDDVIWLHNGVPYIGELEKLDKMLAGTVEGLKTWARSQ